MNRRFRLRRRRAVALALSAGVVTVAAPTAVAATWEDIHVSDTSGSAVTVEQRSAGYTDLRSPDARDAAAAVEQQSARNSDLRSPDARDAALAAQSEAQAGAAARDLRSPDARDAARGITPGSVSAPAPPPVETRTVIAVEERGSQTLAIVFSATALLIALLAVGFIAVARRSRPRWTAP
jgi:hypothetical protein